MTKHATSSRRERPAAGPLRPVAAAPRIPTVTPAARRPHALVVEDDEMLRWLVASALRRRGYVVTAVGDAFDAFAVACPWSSGRSGALPPEVIVCDVCLPGCSGLDLLAAVRASGLLLPVILVTAFGAADTCAAARRLGATALLDKPFAIDDLCRLVCRALAPA
jgi:DNA-binding NtrC family response regulator